MRVRIALLTCNSRDDSWLPSPLSPHPRPSLRFHVSSFFNRWYESLGTAEKSQFKSLIRSGQIEFVNGGWVQNDEANPDPVAMINQMTTGHEYLLKNFGTSPRVAWQIDPFGHSGVTPSLWSLMGFEALVINRIHHSLKDAFKQKRQMEFLWRGVDLGQRTDMFTHVLHTHYSAPPGFDWEEGAIGIDPNNVASRAQELANIMHNRAAAYRTPHLLVPFGDDFKFKSADRQFQNMDRLIDHINGLASGQQYRGMRIRYSTLTDYFEAVSGAQEKFPVLTGDFFPYADNEDSYWTGYYTTRPLLKQKSRKLNHILRACEQLLVLVRSSPHANLDTERRALPGGYWEGKFREVERARMETALFLHHDAITGTSRTNVVQDYQQRMDVAYDQLQQIATRMMEHLLTREPHPPPTLTPDPLVFGPPAPKEAGGGGAGDEDEVFHPIVYYNSLGWVRREVVSVRVSSRAVRILGPSGAPVASQVDAYFASLDDQEGLTPAANLFTVSWVIEVPPLGAQTYYVQIGRTADAAGGDAALVTHSTTLIFCPVDRRNKGMSVYKSRYLQYLVATPAEQYIENAHLKVFFSSDTGLVSQVEEKTAKGGGQSYEFHQRFGHYNTQRSGAYIFRPNGRMEAASSAALQGGVTLRITRGPIVSTVAVRYHGYDVVAQLFGSPAAADSELSGHLAITSTVDVGTNEELIASFGVPPTANFPTVEHEFFTHSGGDFQRRQTKEGGNDAQNFLPCVLGARMDSRSARKRFTIMNTHSMACGSVADGELQLMLHRSLAQDDGRGLAEPVYDASRLDIPLWLSFDPDQTDLDFRRRSIRLNNPMRAFYKLPAATSSPGGGGGGAGGDSFLRDDHVSSPAVWQARQHTSLQPLRSALPPHVHLLTLLARDSVSDDIAMRFQHLSAEKGTEWVGSFADLFDPTYTVSEVRRATLSLNTVLPMSGHRKKTMVFQPAADAPSSPYTALNGLDDTLGKGDSQNTNEEGVFLSQSALEKLRQDQLAKQARATSRRLLERPQQAKKREELHPSILEKVEREAARRLLQQFADDPELSPLGVVADPMARRLFGPATSSSPLFVVKPLQLQTYLFRLSGSEWAEQTIGVHVGVGDTQTGEVRQPERPKPMSGVEPTQLQSGQTPSRAAADGVSVDVDPSSSVNSRAVTPGVKDLLLDPKQSLGSLLGVNTHGPTRPQYKRTTDRGQQQQSPSPSVVGPTSDNVLHGHEHTVIPGRTREAWRLIPSRWEYICVLLASLIGVAFFLQALRVVARVGSAAGGGNAAQQLESILPTTRKGGKKSTL